MSRVGWLTYKAASGHNLVSSCHLIQATDHPADPCPLNRPPLIIIKVSQLEILYAADGGPHNPYNAGIDLDVRICRL